MRIKHPTQRSRRRKQFAVELLCSVRYAQWKWKKFKCIGQFEELKYLLVMFRDGLCLLHGTKSIFKYNSGWLEMLKTATNRISL